jgi:hypothetical protein
MIALFCNYISSHQGRRTNRRIVQKRRRKTGKRAKTIVKHDRNRRRKK